MGPYRITSLESDMLRPLGNMTEKVHRYVTLIKWRHKTECYVCVRVWWFKYMAANFLILLSLRYGSCPDPLN